MEETEIKATRRTVKRLARAEVAAAWKDLKPKAPGKEAWAKAHAEANKWLSAREGMGFEIRHLGQIAAKMADTVQAPDFVLSPVRTKAEELEKAAWELTVYFCTMQDKMSERFSAALVKDGGR